MSPAPAGLFLCPLTLDASVPRAYDRIMNTPELDDADTRKTARAIASNKRRGQNHKADDLIAAGWTVYTPEGDRYDGTQRGNESRPRKT